MDEKNDRKDQWMRTCDHLKSAFEAWDDLCRQDPVISADEKRAQEMRALLKELKSKIEALSEETKTET